MPSDQAFPYDITFEIHDPVDPEDNVTYGFMLETPPGESKVMTIREAGRIEYTQRVATRDVVTYSDFAPLVDTPFAMSSFVEGAGFLNYNSGAGYLWGSGVVTHVDGKVYLASATVTKSLATATALPTGFYTYNNQGVTYDFLWEGTRLWRRENDDGANDWVLVYTADHPISDFAVMDNHGFIAIPEEDDSAIDFLWQNDVLAAATWTPTAANHTPFSNANGKPKFFNSVRGTFYALVDKNKVFFSVNPIVDSWVGPIDTSLTGNISGPPGDDTYAFTGTKAVGDFLFVKKNDAIYSIDSQQDVIEVIWQWKDKPSEHNFKYFAGGSDILFYSVGSEVWTYDPTTGVNTPTGIGKRDGFSVGEILGVDADNRYVYILAKVRIPSIRTQETVALFRGLRLSPSRYAFEILWEDSDFGSDEYGPLKVTSKGVNTLIYWGHKSGSTITVNQMETPAEWDESQTSTFASTGSLYTSYMDSGFPGFDKRHLYFNAEGEYLDANNTIDIEYTLNRGAAFTALVSGDEDNFSADYDNKFSKWIGIKFDFTSQNGTVSPVLNAFDHHQRIVFKYLPGTEILVRLQDEVELRNGTRSIETVDTIWDHIVELRTTSRKITYKDFLGNNYTVTIDNIGIQNKIHEEVGDYELLAAMSVTRADRGMTNVI